MSFRVLPGGLLASAPSLQCPVCNGSRCDDCGLEGTREGFDATVVRRALAAQLEGISDAHLLEVAFDNALEFSRCFRSLRARYVVGLLEEFFRRARETKQ